MSAGTSEAIAIDRERLQLGFAATAEIEGLTALLCQEVSRAHVEGEIAELGPAWRGILLRIAQMNSIAMSVLGEEDGRKACEMSRAIYG